MKSCLNCLKNKFTKCCEHNDNYLYRKHTLPIYDCYKCIHKKIYEIEKLELTEISKSYLMTFIAYLMDLINDETEETKENKDILNNLEKIYDPELRIHSYYIYRDSYFEKNKTDLYILTGYILDKDLSDNDLFVKKIILSQLIKYHSDYYSILSLEELKNMINNK